MKFRLFKFFQLNLIFLEQENLFFIPPRFVASTDISRIIGFWKGGKFIFRHWHRLLVGLWPEPLDSKKSAGYSHHSDVCCHGWDILQLCTVTVQLQVSALAEFWNSTQHCGEQKRNKFKEKSSRGHFFLAWLRKCLTYCIMLMIKWSTTL